MTVCAKVGYVVAINKRRLSVLDINTLHIYAVGSNKLVFNPVEKVV
jgi:hypothetical protein